MRHKQVRGCSLLTLAVALGAAVSTQGCALTRSMGKQATAGAIEGATAQTGDAPNAATVAQTAASGVMTGLFDEELTPDQKANLRALVNEIAGQILSTARGGGLDADGSGSLSGSGSSSGQGPAEALVRPLARAIVQELGAELRAQLGTDGQGPLGQSLAGMARTATTASTNAASDELATLMPECHGPDRAKCLEKALFRWSRVGSEGFVEGVRAELGVLPLVLAFAAGLAVALAAFLLGAAWRSRTRPPPPRAGVLREREV